MNAFPPPTTPPVDQPVPRSRRHGLVVGGVIGAFALVAGGVVVGTALATGDDDPTPVAADLTAQTGNGDLDELFGTVGPFLECLADNIDLEALDVPADPDDMRPDELFTLLEEAMAAGEAAFEACSSEMPTDLPHVIPGPEILDELGDLDLGDIPGFDDLYAELGEVFELPPLEEAEAQLDDALDNLPTWDEIHEQLDTHLGELDLENLPGLGDLFDDLEDLDLENLENLPGLGDLFDDLEELDLDDPENLENLPGLSDLFDDLEELDLDDLENLENLPGLSDLFDDLEELDLDDLEDLENLPGSDGFPEEFDQQLGELEEFLGELPSLDELFGQFQQEFGDVDIDQLLDDLLGDLTMPDSPEG